MPLPPSERSEAGSPGADRPLLRAGGLGKVYRRGGAETHVLRAASLTVDRGESVSLVGRSGSGKSTLISLLAGLIVADSGTVEFDGQDLARLGESGRSRLRAGRIGVVLQRDNLIPFLTAAENVDLAVALADDERGPARARDLLAEVGLAHRADHLPRRLSGGEAQRVSIAVALANDPELLLADEMTGELDSATAWSVMDLVLDACRRRDLALLFVTHAEALAARAERRLRLARGEIHAA